MSKERVEMGLRAAELMLQRDVGIQEQLEQMGLGKNLFNYWGNGGGAPSAMVLQKMEKAGYDVMYIITGRKSMPLIRCKDCQYWKHMEDGINDCTCGRFHLDGQVDPTMHAEDYCSRGVRREHGVE